VELWIMSKPNSIRDFICGCDAQHIQKKNLLQKDQLESLIITYKNGKIYNWKWLRGIRLTS